MNSDNCKGCKHLSKAVYKGFWDKNKHVIIDFCNHDGHYLDIDQIKECPKELKSGGSMNVILKKAYQKYGLVQQTIVAIEELAELQQALTKQLRLYYKSKSYNHIGFEIISDIQEEIADVEIMLEQLKVIYHINHHKINVIKQEKIDRLEKQLEGMNEFR